MHKPLPALHVSVVQTLPSSQLVWDPATHAPAALQVSREHSEPTLHVVLTGKFTVVHAVTLSRLHVSN